MATSTALQPAAGGRVRLLTFPREHGAWGILLVPLFTGAAIGIQDSSAIIPTILLAIAAVALFCLRTPVESLAGTSVFHVQSDSERRAVLSSIAGYGLVAALAVTALLWFEHNWDLVILGAAITAIFLVQAALKRLGRSMRLTAQLIGALGLTSTAAAAFFVTAGKIDSAALVLWIANWLFAANQIHFVQLRIHAARATTRSEKIARGRSFLIGEGLLALILLLGWQFRRMPALALLAFSPVLVRGLMWTLSSRTAPLEVRRLGKSELAHAILFGILLILAFHFGRV